MEENKGSDFDIDKPITENPDIYNGDNILRPERLVGESKEDYKTRRTVINKMVKQRLKYGYNVISR
jgi:hypothetical protein